MCELVDSFAIEAPRPSTQQIDERLRSKHRHQELAPPILVHPPTGRRASSFGVHDLCSRRGAATWRPSKGRQRNF
jgi:hypothetical protein